MKEFIVFLSLITILLCINLNFGIRSEADDFDVFDKRASDEDMDSEVTSKGKQHAGESSPQLQKKRKSLSKKHSSSNRLNARRVRDKLVQRDQIRAESKSFLQGFLAQRTAQLETSDTDVEQKRSKRTQVDRSPTLSKKQAAALHTLRALEERAADNLPEERAIDESDRLVARGERLRAIKELVVHMRSLFAPQVRSAQTSQSANEKLLATLASAVASSSSNSSSNSQLVQAMYGTIVYEATFNTTVPWCRSNCNDQSICASFLYMDDKLACVLHYDIE